MVAEGLGQQVSGAIADSSGQFRSGALRAGEYLLVILDPAGAYRLEFYDDTLDSSTSTRVTVAGGTTTNADIALALAGG